MSTTSATIEPTGGASPAYPHPWRLVIVLAAICALSHFNRVSMAVAGDTQIMQQYGLSPTQMGFIYSVFLVAYTAAMIPGGWLIDRMGPRFALGLVCVGSAVFVALTGGIGFTAVTAGGAMVAFLLIRGMMGLVSAPLHPAAAKAVSLGVPLPRRSSANGLVTGAALLGIASTYVVFGALVRVEWLNWQGAFLVTALATVCLGLLWIRLAGETTARHQDLAATADRELPADSSATAASHRPSVSAPTFFQFLRRNKNLLLLTFSYGAVGYFQYLFFYWMRYYFQEVLELGETASSYYASIPPLAMAVSMPVGGWLSDRLLSLFGWRAARAWLAMIAMSASAALLIIGTRATDNPTWIVVWLSSALGVLGLVEGSFWVTAVEVGRNRGGLSAGIFHAGGNAGGFIAPVVTPWGRDTLGYGWQFGIGVGSIVCLAGAAAWYWITPEGHGGCEPQPVVPSLDPAYGAGASTSS